MLPKSLFVPLLSLSTVFSGPGQATCQQQHTDLQARVIRVLDGDTFELHDHTRIRLIGINAPEFAYRGRPAERLATEASDALSTLLAKSDGHVLLQYGSDKHDRYGRTLAHAFATDGSNLGQQLLLKGLAVRVAFPPNLWAQDCYRRAENLAHNQGLGLWPAIITKTTSLTSNSKGFHIVEGRVERVGFSKKSIWLNFKGRFAARIARADLKYFSGIDFKQLSGRRLRVRGWLYNNKGKAVMRLRHSSMLDIMK